MAWPSVHAPQPAGRSAVRRAAHPGRRVGARPACRQVEGLVIPAARECGEARRDPLSVSPPVSLRQGHVLPEEFRRFSPSFRRARLRRASTLAWGIRLKLRIRGQRGMIVSFSGIDGSGKTVAHIRSLIDAFSIAEIDARRFGAVSAHRRGRGAPRARARESRGFRHRGVP